MKKNKTSKKLKIEKSKLTVRKDPDLVLTKADLKALDAAERDYKAGKARRLF